MDLKKLIFDLCRSGGVSGSEAAAAQTAAAALAPFAKTTADSNGNLFAVLGNSNAAKTILLDAHLDRIGCIVTDINEQGFVKIQNLGGVDVRTLPDTVLQTEDGLTGTVCCLPPHLSDGNEGTAVPIAKTWVDFGMSATALQKCLHIGDTITFAAEPTALSGDKIAAPGLDNRCGVAALIRAAELIDTKTYKVVLLFSVQEEIAGAGTKTGAFQVDADEAIAVDVSFAAQPDVSGQYGRIALGKGPMICLSPVLDRVMSRQLISLAEAEKIPYQTEPIGGATGTNGDHIAVSKCGVKTALLSVPQRYMHTPVEVIALADVENTARLIAAYINSGGAFHD